MTTGGVHGTAVYRLYGSLVASNFAFTQHISRVTGVPDLQVIYTEEPPLAGTIDPGPPAFASSAHNEDGVRLLYVHRCAGYDLLRFTGQADFYVHSSQIVYHLRHLEKRAMVEFHLLGPVLSYWLERQDVLALHCSSVVVDGQAVGFLANSGGGKSSLAASFVRAGHPLLTDDLLPVECTPGGVVGRPGYPQMRLWPAEAQYFVGRAHDLAPIYAGCEKRRVPIGSGEFGAFCETSKPLRCLYLPARRDPAPGQEEIEIVPLSAQSALVELVRCSYTSRLAETLFQPRRMGVLARVARCVPMRRLYYPSDLDFLARVRDAVLADLVSFSRSRVAPAGL